MNTMKKTGDVRAEVLDKLAQVAGPLMLHAKALIGTGDSLIRGSKPKVAKAKAKTSAPAPGNKEAA